MKSSSVADTTEKKGHVCPPSNATHPKDRWESLFVYGFICKFTQLRQKVDGLNSPMDFEEALLLPEPNPIITQILARFVLNLKPQTRNLSPDVISNTVATVLWEFLKTSERTVFWNDELKMNVDPFQDLPDGFWAADWDMKLKILRQLVELQLCHSTEVKASIDRAWGVVHNKHKKDAMTAPPPPPEDPQSQQNLQLIPLGQDMQRKRYWVIDDSPRVYLSTNPWKITATFQTISSTREEYVAIIDKLNETAPGEPRRNERRTKLETSHLSLIKALADRLPAVDAEIARIQKAKKKVEQRQMLIAQAELRETRTRRRTTRPDYAYMNGGDSEDDNDEYIQNDLQEDYDEDEYANMPIDGPSTSRRTSTRRATRSRRSGDDYDEWAEWRTERRSTRLGPAEEMQVDPPRQTRRSRTVESTVSAASVEPPVQTGNNGNLKIKIGGAAAPKPTETIVETVAGKKKSRFWVYAIEPVNPPPAEQTVATGSRNGARATRSNGYNGGAKLAIDGDMDGPPTNGDMFERNSSPASRMDIDES